MHCIAVRPGEDTSIQREDSQLLLSLHSLRTPTPAVWRPLRLLPTLRSRYVLGCPLSCNVRHQQLDATLAPSPLWEHDSPRLRRSIAHPSRNTARALSTPRAAVLAPRDPRRLLYRSSTQHSLYVYTRALLAEHYPKAIIDDTRAPLLEHSAGSMPGLTVGLLFLRAVSAHPRTSSTSTLLRVLYTGFIATRQLQLGVYSCCTTSEVHTFLADPRLYTEELPPAC